MRTQVISLTFLLLAQAVTLAGDRERALFILNQGLSAHGGEGRLAKIRFLTREAKGTLFYFGDTVPFRDELAFDLPTRLNCTLHVQAGGQETQMKLVVNGGQGWQAAGGMVSDLGTEKLRELQETPYIFSLLTLAPLKDKAFTLAPLPETKVNNRTATGIAVANKTRGAAKLFFDRDTGLLIKIQRDTQEAGLPVVKDYIFSDHKSFDGIRLPTKWVEMLNDKKIAEVTVTSYRFPSTLNDSIFAKP